jgi:hypothetical protein
MKYEEICVSACIYIHHYLQNKSLTVCLIYNAQRTEITQNINFYHANFHRPVSPPANVYISQLNLYSGACPTYDQLLYPDRILTKNLMLQKFHLSHLQAGVCKLYCCYITYIANTSSRWD